ncbi:TetR family transcriptional regulator [Ligilactobacillus salitolerans]|uniref:TetR family transcriptional regulator n=1 Tax=Ligilactobacillus salitolerans TaxID=1808352 RepID=A0A401IUC1_9LACO|nr:TetR/AcrR family transcriptional regulator [Ligilactobacillus salitolerans]GBG95153.1 TetR family transcriptional regulator [Ligilactobacillus salitolerans]
MDQEQLLEAARTTFSHLGYKQTNVAKITQTAGIATGSFYKFFPSKEAIFLKLFDQENEALRTNLIKKLGQEADLVHGTDLILSVIFERVRANKILLEWYKPAIGAKLHAIYAKRIANDNYFFMTFTTEWLAARISELNLTAQQQEQIHELLAFIEVIDNHLTVAEFETHSKTLKAMVRAQLQAILAS